jgi:hypothetical protein
MTLHLSIIREVKRFGEEGKIKIRQKSSSIIGENFLAQFSSSGLESLFFLYMNDDARCDQEELSASWLF